MVNTANARIAKVQTMADGSVRVVLDFGEDTNLSDLAELVRPEAHIQVVIALQTDINA